MRPTSQTARCFNCSDILTNVTVVLTAQKNRSQNVRLVFCDKRKQWVEMSEREHEKNKEGDCACHVKSFVACFFWLLKARHLKNVYFLLMVATFKQSL